MKFANLQLLAWAGLAIISGAQVSAQEYFGSFGDTTPAATVYRAPIASDVPVNSVDNAYTMREYAGIAGSASTDRAAIDNANFAIGPVYFTVGAGLGIEFNDNLNLAEHDRQADLVFRPSLTLDAAWQVTEMNTLRLTLGLGYAKYLTHSEYDSDGIIISPLSALEFRFSLGPVRFFVYERLSYQEEPLEIATLSNISKYARWENTAGIQAEYDINSNASISAGYEHYNLWSSGGEGAFTSQDRSIDTIFLRPTYALSPAIRVGINTRYSWIDFDSDARGDGTTLLVGPVLEWILSNYSKLYLEGGYQHTEFGSGTGEAAEDDGLDVLLGEAEAAAVREEQSVATSLSDYYLRAAIENTASETYSHRLSFTKNTEVGFLSSSYDIYHAEYGAQWTGLKDTTVAPSIFYEYYSTGGGQDDETEGEEASRFGAQLAVRHQLTNYITVGLDYRITVKESNIPDASYVQNVAFLSLFYKF